MSSLEPNVVDRQNSRRGLAANEWRLHIEEKGINHPQAFGLVEHSYDLPARLCELGQLNRDRLPLAGKRKFICYGEVVGYLEPALDRALRVVYRITGNPNLEHGGYGRSGAT